MRFDLRILVLGMSLPKDFHAVTSHLGTAADAVGDDERAGNLRTLQSQIDAIARGDLGVVLQRLASVQVIGAHARPVGD